MELMKSFGGFAGKLTAVAHSLGQSAHRICQHQVRSSNVIKKNVMKKLAIFSVCGYACTYCISVHF